MGMKHVMLMERDTTEGTTTHRGIIMELGDGRFAG
jgi:hypothetical protein